MRGVDLFSMVPVGCRQFKSCNFGGGGEITTRDLGDFGIVNSSTLNTTYIYHLAKLRYCCDTAAAAMLLRYCNTCCDIAATLQLLLRVIAAAAAAAAAVAQS